MLSMLCVVAIFLARAALFVHALVRIMAPSLPAAGAANHRVDLWLPLAQGDDFNNRAAPHPCTPARWPPAPRTDHHFGAILACGNARFAPVCARQCYRLPTKCNEVLSSVGIKC